MRALIKVLILFFTCLLLWQLFVYNTIYEGLETQYQQYDTNNPNNALILAQQNAGNIAYLKERMDSNENNFTLIQDLSGNVQTLQTQVNGLLLAQQNYASQLTGGSAPNITGTTDDDEESSTN